MYSWHNIVRMFELRNKYFLDKSQGKESWRLASTCDKWFSISVLSQFLRHQIYFVYAYFFICCVLTLTKFKSCEQKLGQYEYYVSERTDSFLRLKFIHFYRACKFLFPSILISKYFLRERKTPTLFLVSQRLHWVRLAPVKILNLSLSDFRFCNIKILEGKSRIQRNCHWAMVKWDKSYLEIWKLWILNFGVEQRKDERRIRIGIRIGKNASHRLDGAWRPAAKVLSAGRGVVIIIITIIIIMTTRPRPAFGWLGLGGSSGG